MKLRELARLTQRSVIILLGLGLGLFSGQPIFVSRAIAEDPGSSSDDFQSFDETRDGAGHHRSCRDAGHAERRRPRGDGQSG
jgi:hypothetical protein